MGEFGGDVAFATRVTFSSQRDVQSHNAAAGQARISRRSGALLCNVAWIASRSIPYSLLSQRSTWMSASSFADLAEYDDTVADADRLLELVGDQDSGAAAFAGKARNVSRSSAAVTSSRWPNASSASRMRAAARKPARWRRAGACRPTVRADRRW